MLKGVAPDLYKSSRSKSTYEPAGKNTKAVPVPEESNLLKAAYEKQVELNGVYIDFIDQFQEIMEKGKVGLKETCDELGIEVGSKTSNQVMLQEIFMSIKQSMIDDDEYDESDDQ